jgi:creatinine amidohydrolase
MTAIAIPSTTRGPKLLDEMTFVEVEDALTRTDVAIITPSAIEQHGSHLPLGTDWYIGAETTRRTLRILAEHGHQAVGYAFPIGKSDNFLDFPGSLTLSNATFIAVQKEIAACLHHQGFRRFVFMSGNGGNAITMQVACDEVAKDLGAVTLFVDPLPYQFSYRDQVLKNPKIEHHGAEGETSKILVTHPELVDLSNAGYVPLDEAAAARTNFGQGVKAFGAGKWQEFAPRGVVGDPTLAEVATGETMYERNAAWVAGVIERQFFP